MDVSKTENEKNRRRIMREIVTNVRELARGRVRADSLLGHRCLNRKHRNLSNAGASNTLEMGESNGESILGGQINRRKQRLRRC
jgi:hypothetical protein